MHRTNFPGLKQGGDDSPQRKAVVVNNILNGKMNVTLDLTLAVSAASTVIADPRINSTSIFSFDPRTAHAAAELYGGTMWVSSIASGTATITHANNSQSDRVFVVSILA